MVANWHEVMKVSEARALVSDIRQGYVYDVYKWREASETAAITVAVVDNGCHTEHSGLPAPFTPLLATAQLIRLHTRRC